VTGDRVIRFTTAAVVCAVVAFAAVVSLLQERDEVLRGAQCLTQPFE
jgi:hypothetical protein